MPSEKPRYILSNRGPERPYDLGQLLDQLPTLGVSHLSELLAVRSQYDQILGKLVAIALAFREAEQDWDRLKAAIDYALHFPDFVRYTEHGHGQILHEIKVGLDFLLKQDKHELAERAAKYVTERAEEVSSHFEEDWDWRSSLQELIDAAHRSSSNRVIQVLVLFQRYSEMHPCKCVLIKF